MNTPQLQRVHEAYSRPLGLYASWGSRLGAWFIDALLLGFASWEIGRIVSDPSPGFSQAVHPVPIVVAVVAALYFTLCHSLAGQTVGKAVVGLKVFDSRSLGRLSLGRAFLRWLVTLLLWILVVPGLLDSVSPLWNEDSNQAWHDKIARSVVMRVRGSEQGNATAMPAQSRLWTSPLLKGGSIAALGLGIVGIPATLIAAADYALGHGPESDCSDGCWFGTDSPEASHVKLVHALLIGDLTIALFALAVVLGVIQMHRSGLPLRPLGVNLFVAGLAAAVTVALESVAATHTWGLAVGAVSIATLFVCWVRILQLPRRAWRAEE